MATSTRYLTTYGADWHPRWPARTATVWVRDGRARALGRLLRHGPRHRAAILHGAVPLRDGYVDLIAAGILSHGGLPVLLADATWQPGSRALDRLLGTEHRERGYDAPGQRGRSLSRAAIDRMDSPALHYVVLSSAELETLPRTWGIDPARVHFLPFCATIREPELHPGGTGVFAGGDSLRDYRPLLAAAPRIGAEVTIATRLRLPRTQGVRAGALTPEEYARRAAGAGVVVVALQGATERSGGQQTYLNAMGSGKPVVVTDAPGVRDYIEDGETGFIVPPGDPDALADTVNRVLRSPKLAQRVGAAARADVLARFRLEHWFDRLLAQADRLTGSA